MTLIKGHDNRIIIRKPSFDDNADNIAIIIQIPIITYEFKTGSFQSSTILCVVTGGIPER